MQGINNSRFAKFTASFVGGNQFSKIQTYERRLKMSFGEQIAKRRKYLRLTQKELAEKMNVSKSAIAKWETDGGLPDRDNLIMLSEILGIPIGEMNQLIGHSNQQPFEVNITSDIIKVFESYGYKIIKE